MKFYGQWNPPVDKVLYENYFKSTRNGFFIEAGGYDGVSLSCCKFFEDCLGWKGINIEPSRKQFSKLVKNRPKSINLNIGLSNRRGVLEFKDVISGGAGAGNGSFEHGDEHMQELQRYGVQFLSYDVPTTTYVELIREQAVSKVSLLCLDVEGFEIKALNGMKGADVLPEVICIEYSYLGLRRLIKFMNEKLGYHYNFISFNNAFFSKQPTKRTAWFGATDEECVIKDGNIKWIKTKERRG
jgi:FkbM family methyltransferase